MFILGALIRLALLAFTAWMVTLFLPIATAGAVSVGFWQAVAGVFLAQPVIAGGTSMGSSD